MRKRAVLNISSAMIIFLLSVNCFAGCFVTTTSNGLTVILQEDHTNPLVAVDVWVKAGSSHENKNISGVSHFIEHLTFGATAKREPGDMDIEMESLGGTLDAHTSKDWAHFNTTVRSKDVSKALDILADAIMNPQFRKSDVDKERLVILDEIAKKNADPVKICQDILAKDLYGNNSYALPVEGTADTVNKITRDDIKQYHDKYYTADNIAVVMVGDIERQKAIDEVSKAFQSLPSGNNKDTNQQNIAEVKYPESQVNESIKMPFAMDYLAIGFLGPQASDKADVCATDVLLAYLGYGYQSWLMDDLKNKQNLVQNASVDYITQKRPGLISIVVSAKPSDIKSAETAIISKIDAIRKNGIPDNILFVAKRSLLGQFAFQNETVGGRANSYGFYYSISDPAFADSYISSVQAVTNEDILRVANKYLDPAKSAVLKIGSDQGGKS